jgi:hypothetical protein
VADRLAGPSGREGHESWKTGSKEDRFRGKQVQRKTGSTENRFNGKQVQRKKGSAENSFA